MDLLVKSTRQLLNELFSLGWGKYFLAFKEICIFWIFNMYFIDIPKPRTNINICLPVLSSWYQSMS